MLKKTLRIIGINPGTRYLGLAIFQDWNLVDWRIRTLDGKWSSKKIEKTIRTINEYIELYNLKAVVLKKLHPARSSKNLRKLVDRIKSLAARKRIRIFQYSIKELEAIFLAEERHNKKSLAQKMALDYPFLVHELEREQAHKNPYRMKMFEAVALGAACFQKVYK
jgi:RNase H-fold protein (predicted Holliday junction resolvase)